MENLYNDELMPNSYEEMAKAYSHALKKKGFVFIRLEDEEFNLLLGEVFVLIAKMKAILKHLKSELDANLLFSRLEESEDALKKKFDYKKTHQFRCVEEKNLSFLSLVSIENMLVIKLMLLSIKSGELELCNSIITNITSVFAESFSCEGFVVI